MTFATHIYINDPSFITGFNDSSFDWPFILKKLEMFGKKNSRGEFNTTYVSRFADILNGVVRDSYQQQI